MASNEERESLPPNNENEGVWISTFKSIVAMAMNGGSGFCSATDLADDYRRTRYDSMEDRINSLIWWQSTNNFGTGFVTGAGGLITLPVSIPSSMLACWVVQARLVAAIADLCEYDLSQDATRTMVMLFLLGENAAQATLRRVGIQFSQRFYINAIKKLPATMLYKINRLVGMRLVTKYGQTGIVRLASWVPFVGGVAGGIFDYKSTETVGYFAKSQLFRPDDGRINCAANGSEGSEDGGVNTSVEVK